MYTQPTTRQLAVATVWLVTLAGSLVAGIERDHPAVAVTPRASQPAAAQGQLPWLPEVVVTATRLDD
jgi:hypothetical protein